MSDSDKVSDRGKIFSAAESWRPLAEKALRGAALSTLDRRTVDDILRGPVFFDRPAESHAVDTAPRDLHLPWGMRQTIVEQTPSSANEAALADLMGGVSELELRLDPEGRFGLKANELDLLDAALKGVDLSLAPVHLDCIAGQGHHARLALSLFARRRLDGELLEGGLGLGPIERAARQGVALDPDCFTKAREITELSQAAFPRLKVYRLNAALAFEAGGSEVQELAVMAAAGAAYMRHLLDWGFDADTAAGLIEARLAADSDIHLTIAKLRAARRIWARIADAFGVAPDQRRLALHVRTAGRMLSASDAWTNLIRTSCAGFAAAAGGADAITVRPLTAAIGRPNAFARRVARNLHILLAEESHLGNVTDPAAGAFLHEHLSDQLAHQAWALFQDIERRGGLADAFADGWLQGLIADKREQRLVRIRDGQDPILGVTQYVDPDPRPVPVEDEWPEEEDVPDTALAPVRFAAEFEGKQA
ncbi:methylmalonyl-CoA mutase family protein [Maricaulis sp. CAU 1757]